MKNQTYFYILVLLSTIERFGVKNLSIIVGSFNLKFALILSLLPALFLTKNIYLNIYFFIYTIFVFMSSYYNDDLILGLNSVFVLFIFYFIYFNTAKNFAINSGKQSITIIVNISRILIIIGALFYFVGLTPRLTAFFYEPSYMSIFLILYIVAVAFNTFTVRHYDYFLIGLFLILSKSAAFIFIIISVLIYKSLINIKIFIKLFCFGYFLLFIYYSIINDSHVNYSIVKSIIYFDFINLYYDSIARSGERFKYLDITYKYVSEYWKFGIGNREFQNLNNGIPPVNIIFTILLESGIFGLIFLIIVTYIFLTSIKNSFYFHFILCNIVTMFLILMIESTYLRSYLWIYFGIFCGLLYSEKKSNEIKIY